MGKRIAVHDTGCRHEVRIRNEVSVKAALARKITTIVEHRRLTQTEAAELLGMAQPKISAIRNQRLQGISLERLMQALTDLGQHVEIVVSPSDRALPPRIDVSP